MLSSFHLHFYYLAVYNLVLLSAVAFEYRVINHRLCVDSV